MNTSNWSDGRGLAARLLIWAALIALIIVSVPVSSAQSDYLKLGLSDAEAVSLHLFTFSGEPYYSMVHDVCVTEDEALLSGLLSQLDRQYPAAMPDGEPLCWGELLLSDGRIVTLEVFEDIVSLEHGLAVMRCSVPAELFHEYVPAGDLAGQDEAGQEGETGDTN